MKKFFLLFGIVIIALILFLLAFEKIKLQKTMVEKALAGSNFYKEYYNTNDLVLINVWATWCSSCLKEFPKLEKFQENKKVKFISLAVDRDTVKIKKFLEKNSWVKNSDITLKNNSSLDVILNVIGLPGTPKKFMGANFEANIIPYVVLIKNKKILYSAGDDLNINELQKIIDEN